MGFIFYFSVRRESCSHLTPLLFSSNLYVFDEMEEKHSFGVHERDWVWDHRRHRLLPLVVMTKVLMEHFTIYKIGLKSSCWHRKQSKRKQKKKKTPRKRNKKGEWSSVLSLEPTHRKEQCKKISEHVAAKKSCAEIHDECLSGKLNWNCQSMLAHSWFLARIELQRSQHTTYTLRMKYRINHEIYEYFLAQT